MGKSNLIVLGSLQHVSKAYIQILPPPFAHHFVVDRENSVLRLVVQPPKKCQLKMNEILGLTLSLVIILGT